MPPYPTTLPPYPTREYPMCQQPEYDVLRLYEQGKLTREQYMHLIQCELLRIRMNDAYRNLGNKKAHTSV